MKSKSMEGRFSGNYKKGGKVKKTGIARLHKKEKVKGRKHAGR